MRANIQSQGNVLLQDALTDHITFQQKKILVRLAKICEVVESKFHERSTNHIKLRKSERGLMI